MRVEVRLPQWGMGMQEGTVVRWFKREGDAVTAGEDLVEIEAAKTTQSITAPESGILERVLVAEGDTIPVRTVLARLGAGAPSEGSLRRVPVTPVARKLAKDLGIDLDQVTGSGPGGRIDEADVRAYAQPASAPGAGSGEVTQAMSAMRRAIARNMHASLHTMAQLTLVTELDATELVRLRERLQRDFPLTVTDIIVFATALALRRHPRLNASIQGDEIHMHPEIHVGLAVALEDGLIVPVIRGADRKTLEAIAAESRALADRARGGQLLPREVTGSTFTISNLGTFGIDAFTPIVNPPEAAILGVGRIIQKPAEYNGTIALRHRLTLSLTHDHRLVDGAPAAAFLQTLVELLETPYFLGSYSITARS